MDERRRRGDRGRPKRDRGYQHRPRSGPERHRVHDRPRSPPPQERTARPIRARGRAGDVGLDGSLRVELEPVDLALVADLQSRRGAEVVHPRGGRVGRLIEIVGTLQRPIAIVELGAEVRQLATELRGRELHLI